MVFAAPQLEKAAIDSGYEPSITIHIAHREPAGLFNETQRWILEHYIDIETGAMVAAKWITTRSVSGSTFPSTRTSPRGSRNRIVPGAGAEGVDAAGSATPPSLASFTVTGSKARPHASAPSRPSR